VLPASRLVSSAPLFPVAPVIRIIVQSPFADMYFDTRDGFRSPSSRCGKLSPSSAGHCHLRGWTRLLSQAPSGWG